MLKIKESIFQEDIVILKVYIPNNRVSKNVRQKLTELQREIQESTVIVGDFNTSLSKTDRRAFPGGLVVKNLPANTGDMGSIPGLGRSHMPRGNKDCAVCNTEPGL